MIVSRALGFVLTHNPKVAGTSVRDSLEPLHDTPFDFSNSYPDPLTGERTIDCSHVGTHEFPHFYPDILQTTLPMPFFALYGDTKSRFLAAVNQYSKMYSEVDIRFADTTRENLQPEVRHSLNDPDLEPFDSFIARLNAKNFNHFRALGTLFDRVHETITA
ncbi:hypothetical protein [Albibacillus kandeliae]|uniref:hypothetical protein n=1 Tax=Albibacillus kandeliae TaxID=2174228 RepID=UPI0013006CF1|nr:hypothetical protein [Albibacillus kandeliae]